MPHRFDSAVEQEAAEKETHRIERKQAKLAEPKNILSDKPATPMSLSLHDRTDMHSRHVLKIGLFGTNCSSGRAVTMVPERWSGGWEDNLDLAKMADDAGLDFILPIGRWKGYGGDTDYQGATLETLTWASGLLGATRHITVFGTVHANLVHPLVAAKQFVTADQIGRGRFGLNVVCGWNEGEYEMFGIEQRDHAHRYEFAQEWLDIVKRALSPEDRFDVTGTYFKLKDVRSKPKPVGGSRPVIMNAGASPTGRAFALKNCDAFFTTVSERSLPETSQRVREIKAEAGSYGREIDVYTVGAVTCRPTTKEARDYHHYAAVECADWNAVDDILAIKKISPATVGPEAFAKQRELHANGMGGLPLVGDPDHVAGVIAQLSAAGLKGFGISLVNFLAELPFFCDEVLPRLQRLGLRTA